MREGTHAGTERLDGGPIRLVVADDEKAVIDVLRALIQGEDDLQLVGSARDAEGAIALAVNERPDVALVDVRMPGGGGLRAAREITRRCPDTRVIALTAHEDEATIVAMMGAGAYAYVPKGGSTGRILGEIHRGASASRGSDQELGRVDTVAGERRPAGKRRRAQRARVREVLEGDAITAAFQPIFDVETGTVVGAEALARIARLPIRSADAWFAEAGSVGLLLEFELAAVRAALRHLPEIPVDAFLAINVSPTTILSPLLEPALGGFPAERIVIEITEHAQVEDYGVLNEALALLRARGVRVAVDDVGAGIASLRHVVMLGPDLLKIDASLTDGVETDPGRHAVVAALTSCAEQLGAKVVAEGVAGRDQLEELTRLGVDLVQGFLLAEPGSMSDITWNEALRSHPLRADTKRRINAGTSGGAG